MMQFPLDIQRLTDAAFLSMLFIVLPITHSKYHQCKEYNFNPIYLGGPTKPPLFMGAGDMARRGGGTGGAIGGGGEGKAGEMMSRR